MNLSNYSTIALILELEKRGVLIDAIFTDADVFVQYGNILQKLGNDAVKYPLTEDVAKDILKNIGTHAAIELINEQIDNAVERYVTIGLL